MVTFADDVMVDILEISRFSTIFQMININIIPFSSFADRRPSERLMFRDYVELKLLTSQCCRLLGKLLLRGVFTDFGHFIKMH